MKRNYYTSYETHRILRNAVYCHNCKTEIESKYTHNFVSCKCGSICADGGKSYIRRVGDIGQPHIEERNVYERVMVGADIGMVEPTFNNTLNGWEKSKNHPDKVLWRKNEVARFMDK